MVHQGEIRNYHMISSNNALKEYSGINKSYSLYTTDYHKKKTYLILKKMC